MPTVRRRSQDFTHDNSFYPHFTDVETEPQGTSVACLATSWWAGGWNLNPVAWLWNLCFWSTVLDGLPRAPLHPQEHHRWGQQVGPHSASLPAPPGLLVKLRNGHINTGMMSSILVAFRSQEPVWSCAPRFMFPHPLELMGKVCINHEW